MAVERKRRALADCHSHMLSSIAEINQFVGDMNYEAFAADRRTSRAVERCLEIISEASRDVPPDVQEMHPEIPWRQVADSGNVFRHIYDRVSSRIVWQTVTDDLPKLQAVLLKIRDRATNEENGK